MIASRTAGARSTSSGRSGQAPTGCGGAGRGRIGRTASPPPRQRGSGGDRREGVTPATDPPHDRREGSLRRRIPPAIAGRRRPGTLDRPPPRVFAAPRRADRPPPRDSVAHHPADRPPPRGLAPRRFSDRPPPRRFSAIGERWRRRHHPLCRRRQGSRRRNRRETPRFAASEGGMGGIDHHHASSSRGGDHPSPSLPIPPAAPGSRADGRR